MYGEHATTMKDSAIQIGLPCAYPLLCQWIGIVLIIAFIGLLAGIVYSVLKDKKRKQLNREQSRQRKEMKLKNRQHSKDKPS